MVVAPEPVAVGVCIGILRGKSGEENNENTAASVPSNSGQRQDTDCGLPEVTYGVRLNYIRAVA